MCISVRLINIKKGRDKLYPFKRRRGGLVREKGPNVENYGILTYVWCKFIGTSKSCSGSKRHF